MVVDSCGRCTRHDNEVHEKYRQSGSHVEVGHSMLCFIDSDCKSRLRILRLASTHYPSLRSFLHAVYGARNSHLKILKLDEALSKGDFSVLMKASSVSLDTIFSLVEEHVQEGSDQTSDLVKPDLELRLHVCNAEVIADYQKAVDDFPKNVCCSCHQLHQRKNVKWSSLMTN